MSTNHLHVEEIGPGGHLIFLILAGQSKLLPKRKEKIWQGIQIYGSYLAEGYASSEDRKVYFAIPKKDFKPLR